VKELTEGEDDDDQEVQQECLDRDDEAGAGHFGLPEKRQTDDLPSDGKRRVGQHIPGRVKDDVRKKRLPRKPFVDENGGDGAEPGQRYEHLIDARRFGSWNELKSHVETPSVLSGRRTVKTVPVGRLSRQVISPW